MFKKNPIMNAVANMQPHLFSMVPNQIQPKVTVHVDEPVKADVEDTEIEIEPQVVVQTVPKRRGRPPKAVTKVVEVEVEDNYDVDEFAHVPDHIRIEQIAERFTALEDLTTAAITGDIRAMIVSGPPGIGKSHGVNTKVEMYQTLYALQGKEAKGAKAEIISGSVSPIGLYQTLYKYSAKGSIVVFDDCDSILFDEDSLNLLKRALNSGDKRKISWLKESSVLSREDIPTQFDFYGSIIFITNINFQKVRGGKMRDHLDALQSRCHYLDLTLDSVRDKLLRIKQIAATGELFSALDIDDENQNEIIDFMVENQDSIREMSLRMAVKIAQLYKSIPNNWRKIALMTCTRSKAF